MGEKRRCKDIGVLEEGLHTVMSTKQNGFGFSKLCGCEKNQNCVAVDLLSIKFQLDTVVDTHLLVPFASFTVVARGTCTSTCERRALNGCTGYRAVKTIKESSH